MALDVKRITRKALAAIFRLGSPVVREGQFYRPPAFHPGTGQVIGSETVAACQFVGGPVLSVLFLGLAPVTPGTETLVIRATELAGISAPGRGDYLIESASGLRRNVEGARLDPSGEFWTLQCVRTLDEDWGDLTPAGTADDWGDLSAATLFEDWMGLT